MSFVVNKNSSRFGILKENSDFADIPINENEVEDIIDLSHISFDDEETWLYETTECPKIGASALIFTNHQTDILNDYNIKDLTQDICSKESSSKYINTQTFTRPKKKFIRPSIEKYNQELFGDNYELLNRSSSPETSLNKTLSSECPQLKPLEFDLTQSVTSYYFDKIDIDTEDTFQNESLPSLVNSMCSSTFTNLMESSFIKNDPVLKQICDTDFTTSILSQGSEPSSLMQSHYGTNDVDEFLTKVAQDDVLKSLVLNSDEMKCSGDASYIVYKKDGFEEGDRNKTHIMDFEEYHDASDANFIESQNQNQHNGTFRKNSRLSSATFRKTEYARPTLGRNHTYEIDPKDIEEACNVTATIESPKSSRPNILRSRNETIVKSNSMESFKNTTILKDSCNNDLNRYASKESNLEVECISSKGGSKKSLDCSIGSADSLDRMSTLSSSSKGSNKMLNMEEVEAIVEKQEQSLQVMSTPKPNWSTKVYNRVMWEHSIISPIVTGEIQSDSGESSDEYKSVKSSFSKNSVESNPVKQTRSLVSLQDPMDARKLKSINTVMNQGNLYKVPMRGSASNLQKMSAPIPKLSQMRAPSAGSINTNLKTMKPSLKGSYTSLKPVNTYLPVAPPINAPSQGQNSTYLASVNPNAQNQGCRNVRTQGADTTVVKMSSDGVFVKPNGPLRSGLPRPTSSTSIPKPVSRIPGPRRFIPLKTDPSRKGS